MGHGVLLGNPKQGEGRLSSMLSNSITVHGWKGWCQCPVMGGGGWCILAVAPRFNDARAPP